jgi:beta-1,4-mannosyl-glycoprotein beta-1,4-N-acetylglucosaminyltransferase
MTVAKIIDGFIFYNELDMLEYRLSILYPHVDAFILVESTRTFIGTPKPLYYQENRDRYAKYADKIIHVVVDDFWEKPQIGYEHHSTANQWSNEDYQRNAISLGIEEYASNRKSEPEGGGGDTGKDDIFMISDLDEITDPGYFHVIRAYLNPEEHPELDGVVGWKMDYYYYNLKHKFMSEECDRIRAVTYERFLKIPVWDSSHHVKTRVRNLNGEIRMKVFPLLPFTSAWHLSYFGSENFIENKIKNFSHQEYNREEYTDPDKIRERMKKGEDLFGRDSESRNLKRVEFWENSYLPPFPPCPEGVDPYSLFPFTVPTLHSQPLVPAVSSETYTKKQRVVDCFIFYNELDMLEYRLSVLYPHIDAFVLVESTRTFVGNPKPLYYQENRKRYAKYADKIVHVVVDDFIAKPNIDSDFRKGEQWINENYQRNSVSIGIRKLEEGVLGWILEKEDVLLICDVDEIVDTRKLDIVYKVLEIPEVLGLISIPMDMYYYNLTNKIKEVWTHVKAIHYECFLKIPFIQEKGMQLVRNISKYTRLSICKSILGSYGWHLSFFGDAHTISNKIKQFSHQEFNSTIFTNPDYIKERMEKGVDILGRTREAFEIQKIELYENPYLPPFPEGMDSSFLKFPFTLG